MWILIHFIKITCLHQQFDTEICKNNLWNSVFKAYKTLRFHQRPLQFCVNNARFLRESHRASKWIICASCRFATEKVAMRKSSCFKQSRIELLCYVKIIYLWQNQFKTPSQFQHCYNKHDSLVHYDELLSRQPFTVTSQIIHHFSFSLSIRILAFCHSLTYFIWMTTGKGPCALYVP